MAIRSPWEEIADINRQMDDFFTRAFGLSPHHHLLDSEIPEGPDLDMYEKDETIMVEAAVPGFVQSDLKVEATPDSIRIEGERQTEPIGDRRHHRHSHRSGFTRFSATLPLPAEIDPSKVDAKLEHGVLKVALPKSEHARLKGVRVSVKT